MVGRFILPGPPWHWALWHGGQAGSRSITEFGTRSDYQKTFTEENSRARRSEESRLSAPTIKKSQGVSSKESMKKSDTAEDGIKGSEEDDSFFFVHRRA